MVKKFLPNTYKMLDRIWNFG